MSIEVQFDLLKDKHARLITEYHKALAEITQLKSAYDELLKQKVSLKDYCHIKIADQLRADLDRTNEQWQSDVKKGLEYKANLDLAIEAGLNVIELCEQCGDFSNGVTEHGVDEGRQKSWEIINRHKETLAKLKEGK